jgi:hypothetical protein
MIQTASAAELGKLGEACFERRAIPEALHYFQREVEAGADPCTHGFQRWACWMLLGEFERAWQESDRSAGSVCGEPLLTSSRVVIYCLRGLGDAIQFLRFTRQLRRRCADITLQAPARLLPLLEQSPCIDTLVPLDSYLDSGGFDRIIECSELPYLLRTTPDTLPPADAHLRLAVSGNGRHAGPPLRIGVVWAAGSWNPGRSIPLASMEPLFRLPGLSLCSLQRGPEAHQLRRSEHRSTIHDAEQEAGTILDTVAVLRDLDLLISVDTMVAHLAGALGTPVWTLLPFAADWRWMLERSDTPWYPSMRLFRQPRPGDWDSVVREVVTELMSMQGRPD